MARMYSARHYQNVASILSAHAADRRSEGDPLGEAQINRMAVSFADVFENDSPLVEREKGKMEPAFQRERFLEAASADSYPFGDRRSK